MFFVLETSVETRKNVYILKVETCATKMFFNMLGDIFAYCKKSFQRWTNRVTLSLIGNIIK